MSGATPEMDAIFKKAVVLLHSSAPNSATEMRLLVDELIKQRFGPEKMIVNKVSKKTLDTWESNFPGRVTTPPPEAQKEPPEIIDITDESRGLKSDEVFDLDSLPERDPEVIGFASGDTVVASGTAGGPITVADDDDPMAGNVDDDGNLKDFGDLNCCVCGEMMFTATNRLVECSKCGTLYHQECHKPPISNEEASEDQQHNWQCEPCLSKPSTSKAAGIIVVPDDPLPTQVASKPKLSATSSRSSSSSNPSSPFFGKAVEPAAPSVAATASVLPMAPPSPTNVLPTATTAVPSVPSTSSSSRHHHSSKSSSSSKSKEERSTSGSRSGSGSEKAHSSSSSSSTRKSSSHSSSSKKSSSRHHDSSSKRKSK